MGQRMNQFTREPNRDTTRDPKRQALHKLREVRSGGGGRKRLGNRNYGGQIINMDYNAISAAAGTKGVNRDGFNLVPYMVSDINDSKSSRISY